MLYSYLIFLIKAGLKAESLKQKAENPISVASRV
jgi:hypothetical protein